MVLLFLKYVNAEVLPPPLAGSALGRYGFILELAGARSVQYRDSLWSLLTEATPLPQKPCHINPIQWFKNSIPHYRVTLRKLNIYIKNKNFPIQVIVITNEKADKRFLAESFIADESWFKDCTSTDSFTQLPTPLHVPVSSTRMDHSFGDKENKHSYILTFFLKNFLETSHLYFFCN